ncbi:putative armadillo-like helical protein [Helianthus annuus]|uniref:Armadillo-like helical protein n=2 Tax=Helianthus annuus TaxID=4232 RepID=A0A9K3IMK8_HELAN|nr:putative armadillo-like helical protein [Helianthus annuus]
MVFLCSCGGLIWVNRVHVCGTIRCSCGGMKYEGRGHCCGYIPDYSKPPTNWELYTGYRSWDEWIGSPTWGKRSPSLFGTKNQETKILNTASAMEEIQNLQQTGSFQDYCDSFDLLLTKVILSEEYATSLFVRGLKSEIKLWVKFLNPKTLNEAYEKAKNQVNLLGILDGNKEYKKVGKQSSGANSSKEYSETEIQTSVEVESEIEVEIQELIGQDSGDSEYALKVLDEMPKEKVNALKGDFKEQFIALNALKGDFKEPLNKKDNNVRGSENEMKDDIKQILGLDMPEEHHHVQLEHHQVDDVCDDVPTERVDDPLNFLVGECQLQVGQEDGQKLFDILVQKLKPTSVKHEYISETSNIEDFDVDYMLDEPVFDATNSHLKPNGNSFLEVDDLHNDVKTETSLDILNEYPSFLMLPIRLELGQNVGILGSTKTVNLVSEVQMSGLIDATSTLVPYPEQVALERLFRVDDIRVGATSRKAIPALVDLLKPIPDRPGAPFLALGFLIQLGNDSSSNKIVMVESGALEALTKYLSLGPQEATEEAATDLLGILFSTAEIRRHESAYGAVSQLIAVLRMGGRGARYSVAKALENLFCADHIRNADSARHAVQPLVELLNSGLEKDQHAAIAALVGLLSDNPLGALAVADVEMNAVDVLCRILSSNCSMDLKGDATELCCVLFGNARIRSTIAAARCVEPLISLLVSELSPAQHSVVLALAIALAQPIVLKFGKKSLKRDVHYRTLQGEFASVIVRYDSVVGLSIITAMWTKKRMKYSSSNGAANCHDICSYEVGFCEKKIILVGSLELQSKAQKFSQFPFDTFD